MLELYTCAPKEKNNLSSADDSVKLEAKGADSPKNEAALPAKIPIDTIPIVYPNGSKFLFLVYDYYDSLPDRKLIYDFEIRDAATNESIFRSVSIKLFFEEEIDHFNGDRDSLSVYPLHSISSKNPLIVDLNFFVKGGLGYRYLGDVTYPFYKESNILEFLRYTFQLDNNKLVARSSLQYTPRKCSTTEDELIAQFNKLKSEKHLDTYLGMTS